MRASEDMARVESEAGIIATLIHHPDFSYYSEQLLPNHFTNEENRYIYQAICSLAREGIERIDPYNIIQALMSKEATRRFADELSIDQLYALMENSEHIGRNTVEEYKLLVNNVMDAAFRRDTYQQLKECQKLCTQPTSENIEQKIYKMLDDVMMEFSTTNDVPPYKDVIDKCWEEIKGRQGAGYAGIPFKFPALNDYATIERGELLCHCGLYIKTAVIKEENMDLSWYVYRQDWNTGKIEPWDIFEHWRFAEDTMSNIKRFCPKPNDDDNSEMAKAAFEQQIKSDLMYYFWSKAEYEIVLKNWIGSDCEIKIDIYDQVTMNWDRFIDYLWRVRDGIDLQRRVD